MPDMLLAEHGILIWLAVLHLAGLALVVAIVGLTVFLTVDYCRDRRRRLLP